MSGFVSGLERFISETEMTPLSTGSPELDRLLGGVRGDSFHLFYGNSELIEDLFRNLIVNALKPDGRIGEPRVVYMLCGNYRVEKTLIGTEDLVRLLDASGLTPEEALKRVYVLTAASADQQTLLADGLERLLDKESEINLVLVRGISTLLKDDARVRERGRVREEVQRSTTRIRQICFSRNIPLVASGRAEKRGRGLPQPEGGSLLKHLANVIVYLRGRERASEYSQAFVVKNPVLSPRSIEFRFEVREDMGRSTPPFRVSFQEMISKLKREFRDALLKVERRGAFDQLVEAWSSELGAMSFAESLTLLDLMLLVAAVENRTLLNDLIRNAEVLNERISHIEENLT